MNFPKPMLPRVDPEFDRWYLAVTCDKCGSKLILFRDLNEGRSDLLGAIYSLQCSRCKSLAKGKAERYRHRERRRPNVTIEIV
jgi:RNase P subunit RPR2